MMLATSLVSKLYKSTPLAALAAPPEIGAPGAAAPRSFSETLAEAGKSTVQSLGKAEDAAMRGMAGTADPHAVVEALAAAEMALETAVSIRDKAVEAYQEILRMPV